MKENASIEHGEEKTFVVEVIWKREYDGTNLRDGSVVNIILTKQKKIC